MQKPFRQKSVYLNTSDDIGLRSPVFQETVYPRSATRCIYFRSTTSKTDSDDITGLSRVLPR